jgi:predicted RNase H-like nuclease (RuvC/YqgF family)
MRDEHKQELDVRTSEVEPKLTEPVRSVKGGLKSESAKLQTELNATRGEQEALVCRLQREMKRRKQQTKAADDLRAENERLRNLIRDWSDSVRGCESLNLEFRRLKELLDLEPAASPRSVFEVVGRIIARESSN